jgi:AcrR family transcriptional regulator
MTSRVALSFLGITKESIIEVGLQLIEDVGLENFSVEKLAERCHIRPTSTYKYFRGHEDLQDGLTAGALALLVDAHQEVHMTQVGREALEAYALVERAYAQAHPILYAVALRAPRGQGAELRLLRQAYMAIATKMLRGYDIPAEVAPEIANCLSAALQGFVSAEIAGRGRTGPEFDRNYERLLDMLDAGARNARSSSRSLDFAAQS